MQKIWIKMLATGCAISLFMTTSGMMVMAEELQEDVVVTSAENLEETIEYERTLDEEELIVEDEITEQGIDEDIVGVGNVTVGNNVTATFDSSTGAIKFYSNGGTLWSDWIEKGGFDRNEQIRLKECCDRLTEKGIKFILSNSNTPFIRELYKEYEIITVNARRNINSNSKKRGEIEEVIVRNYD